MTIPKGTEIKPVILAVLGDGRERRSEEIQEVAAKHFRLTRAELREQAGSGHTRFQNEHAFALGQLRSERLIALVDKPRRIYRATTAGVREARHQSGPL